MNRSFSKIGAGLFALCLTTALSSHAAVGPVSGKITRLATAHAGDGMFISINTAYTTTCPGTTQFIVPIAAPQYKEIVALAMAARAQDRTVTIFYDNAACPNGWSPTLIALTDSTW